MKKIIFTLAVLSLTGCLEGGGGGGGGVATSPSPDPVVVAPPPVVVLPPPVAGNDAPVLIITDSLTGSEGQEIVLHLIGSDANGDALTYSCVTGCIAGMVLNAQNEFRWTPSFTQAGSYPIRFRVQDALAYQDYDATVVITNVNRAPVMGSITSGTVAQGASIARTPTASDPDGDSGIIQLVSALPANATFTAGVLTFNPSFAQTGTFSFTFRAFDGALYSANQTVVFTVSNTNRAPVLTSIGAKAVNENSLLSFSISASDLDGDTLTASASGLPTGATFNTSTGAFSWTPSCTRAGSYNVTFQVSDGFLNASEIVNMVVTNINCDGAPTWQNASTILSTSGENVVIQLTYAVDNDAITYGYVNESDCNNANWGQTFNAAGRTLSVTRTRTAGGHPDYSNHRFIVYAQDSFGARNYYRLQIAKNNVGPTFVLGGTPLGSIYSNAGMCGAGPIYTHP